MKKNTIEIIITSILVVVLLFAVSNILNRGKKSSAKKESTGVITAEKKQPEIEVTSAKTAFKDLEDRAKELKWDRDPFTHNLTHSAVVTEELRLEGIVWDNQSPKAMINDKIIGVGEKVGNYTVLEITPGSVTLTNGVKEAKLEL